MLNVVSGYGPRVGSSAVMRELIACGYEIHGTPYMHGLYRPEFNLGGYYDLHDEEVESVKCGIAKVWPRQIHLLPKTPAKLVLLDRRDKSAWLTSVTRFLESHDITVDVEETLSNSREYMDTFLGDYTGEVYHVYTEDLDKHLKDIIEFIGE